jgi:hypothetical protein
MGRPLASRGVHPINGNLVPPDEIVLESSFVAEALIPSQRHYEECRTFMSALPVWGTTVYFSELLEPELWEAAYGIAIRELHPKRDKTSARQDGRTRRRATRIQREMERAWDEAVRVSTRSRSLSGRSATGSRG